MEMCENTICPARGIGICKMLPPIDGVVIKVDSYEAKERLDATSEIYKWAIALKSQDSEE